MRQALLLCAVLVGFGSQAFADDLEFQFGSDAPIRFHHAHPLIVVRQGVTAIPIQFGLTSLDRGKSPIKCLSAAGCLITAKIWVGLDGTEYEPTTVSGYVDGVAMVPAPTQDTYMLAAQQSVVVPQGIHTLRSQVRSARGLGNITGWNVEYSIYNLK